MDKRTAGAIDCDCHPSIPSLKVLLPYLDEFWREQMVDRHIDRMPFNLTSYPRNAPLTSRPQWRGEDGTPGGDLAMLQREALDRFGSSIAILNPLHGLVLLFNEDMTAALCRALNDYIRAEWLDRDPRLRASIVVSPQNPELAVEEIERLAPDPRFVQVLFFVMGEIPLGRRVHWPILAAAEKHGLAVGVHAGSMYRHAPSVSGWPSYHAEDYILQSTAFENLLMSFVAEGVFERFPLLRLVMLESGFTWLPHLLWRVQKVWRGVRAEIPWVKQSPMITIRERVHFTLQPVDRPPTPQMLARVIDQIGSDQMLLFSTDYPHAQFQGDDVLPEGLSDERIAKMLSENAYLAYPRLAGHGREAARAEEAKGVAAR